MEDIQKLSGSRERILLRFYNEFMIPLFLSKGYTLPTNVRVSIGVPRAGNIAGSTYHPTVGNNYYHIFISPFQMYNVWEIFGTLMHEAIHTLYFDHLKGFQTCAAAVGLVAPWTASTNSPELDKAIDLWMFEKNIEWSEPSLEWGGSRGGVTLPGGGHAKPPRPIGAPKPQSARMIKLSCPDCNYIVRTSRTNVSQKGYPVCPCGSTFVED